MFEDSTLIWVASAATTLFLGVGGATKKHKKKARKGRKGKKVVKKVEAKQKKNKRKETVSLISILHGVEFEKMKKSAWFDGGSMCQVFIGF